MSFNYGRDLRRLACALFGLPSFACARAPAASTASGETAASSLESITVQRPALYPETIAYDAASDQFLLGSFREGAVYRVNHAGQATPLVDDPRLCSVLGIALDARRGRLWAVSSDLGASLKPSVAGPKKLAGVGIYDLRTGKPSRYVDLASLIDGPHLLNGIALDAAGTAYVTDSFSPCIYRVDAMGQASIFAQDSRFVGEGINLNGVVVHPRGYLLVIKKSDGSLFKVPLDAPGQLTKVVSDATLVGGDGLTLSDEKSLVVIANRTPKAANDSAYWLSSDDDWATAKVRQKQPLGDVYPTTAARRDGVLYVVRSRLNELIGAARDRQSSLHEAAMIQPLWRDPR